MSELESIAQADTKSALEKLIDASGEAWEREAKECSNCHNHFVRVLETFEGVFCRDCYGDRDAKMRIQRESNELRTRIHEIAPGWLLEAGLSKRELQADDRMPTPAMGALAKAMESDYTDVRLGNMPTRGVGLSGPAGVGKSFALAGVLKRCAYYWLLAALDRAGRAGVAQVWLRWLRWPERVQAIRTTSLRDGGHGEIAEWIEDWSEAPLLVLDDLGAERMRGSYEEDFAFSILDQVIDARCGAMLPTWFTTNLSADDLLGRLGARVYSRLLQDSQLIEVKGRDLRRAE